MSLLEGTLADTPLSEVLLRLHAESRTGVLTLQSKEDIFAISFDEGRVVAADALNETLEEGLGGVLVDEGLVTESEFEEAAGRVGTQSSIGDVLVDEGLMTRDDFLAALRRYTIGLVQVAQSWSTGDFKFYVGEDVSFEEGFEPVRVKEVLPLGTVPQMAEPEVPTEEEQPVEKPEPPAPEAKPDSLALGPIAEEAPGGPEPIELEGGWMDVFDSEPEPSALQATLRRVNDWLAAAPDWVARVAPILVLVVLVTVVLWRPNSLVYPFFWLETDRLELEKQRRTSVYLKIDRAAKTFFLLEGRFPDDLHSLVARGLLSPDDILGAGGRVLAYTPGDRGYVIRPGAPDGTDPGVSKTEAIAGDFFLDPEFVIQPPDRGPAPLVLLD